MSSTTCSLAVRPFGRADGPGAGHCITFLPLPSPFSPPSPLPLLPFLLSPSPLPPLLSLTSPPSPLPLLPLLFSPSSRPPLKPHYYFSSSSARPFGQEEGWGPDHHPSGRRSPRCPHTRCGTSQEGQYRTRRIWVVFTTYYIHIMSFMWIEMVIATFIF